MDRRENSRNIDFGAFLAPREGMKLNSDFNGNFINMFSRKHRNVKNENKVSGSHFKQKHTSVKIKRLSFTKFSKIL